ncbi:MAG: Flp pilus assembly complex ATPase component TadA [Clostridia bacterium]|nr:Flp pilus assembly complex ATPase component TadA [Clostridia bacterium]
MLLVEHIIEEARKRDASDIHFLFGLKPILRISRKLTELEDVDPLEENDLYEIYEYIIQGNVEKDQEYKENRRLDTSLVYKDLRLRVNCSFSDDIPVFTMRLIKNELPPYESLGVPDIVRRMTYLPQGLMLITGKTNSGKSTTLSSLVDHINQTQNRKILCLESPIEYKHTSKKSIIVQKEVGPGKDVLEYRIGVMNALREDCDVLVIGEIRDKKTMEAAIDMAESGHLVIGTLHTKSCAETVDRMLNFYEVHDQAQIKNLLSGLLKLVISQRLLRSADGTKLVLVPEVMVVDNTVSACIRKEKFSLSEIEDAIQSNLEKGSVGLMNSLAKLYVQGDLDLDTCKMQLEEKNYETFSRIISQTKLKMGNDSSSDDDLGEGFTMEEDK